MSSADPTSTSTQRAIRLAWVNPDPDDGGEEGRAMNEQLRALARFLCVLRPEWDSMTTHAAIAAAMRRRKNLSVHDVTTAATYAASIPTLLSLAEALADDSHDCWKLADMARVDVNGVWHASRRDKAILTQAREDRELAAKPGARKAAHNGYVRAMEAHRIIRESRQATGA